MTRKRDTDLKERMLALRVNEPLKLKREAFVFQAPHQESEVPRNEAPPLSHPHSKQPQNEHTQNEKGEPLAPQASTGKSTEPEVPRSKVAQKEVRQFEQPQKEVTEVEAANVAQCEGPRNDQPQNEAPQREMSGFFKLSHRVFGEPLLRDLSGDSFRLFLWLSSRAWRFASSDGTVRASVGFIESQAGMSHATISRALKTLKEKGLISILEVDFKKGNLWQVSSIACSHTTPGNDPDGRPPQKKVPQNEAPRSSTEATSNRAGTSLKMRQQPPQNEEDLRSYKKLKKSKEVPTKNVFLVLPSEPDGETDLIAPEEAIALFEQKLPNDTQEQIIAGYMNREYPHGFFPPARVVKTLAAKDWYRSNATISISASA